MYLEPFIIEVDLRELPHQHFFLNPTEMLVAVVFIFVCREEDEVEDEAIK